MDVGDDLQAYRDSPRGQSAAQKQFGCGCIGALITMALLIVCGLAVAAGRVWEAMTLVAALGVLGWLFWYRTSRSRV